MQEKKNNLGLNDNNTPKKQKCKNHVNAQEKNAGCIKIFYIQYLYSINTDSCVWFHNSDIQNLKFPGIFFPVVQLLLGYIWHSGWPSKPNAHSAAALLTSVLQTHRARSLSPPPPASPHHWTWVPCKDCWVVRLRLSRLWLPPVKYLLPLCSWRRAFSSLQELCKLLEIKNYIISYHSSSRGR